MPNQRKLLQEISTLEDAIAIIKTFEQPYGIILTGSDSALKSDLILSLRQIFPHLQIRYNYQCTFSEMREIFTRGENLLTVMDGLRGCYIEELKIMNNALLVGGRETAYFHTYHYGNNSAIYWNRTRQYYAGLLKRYDRLIQGLVYLA